MRNRVVVALLISSVVAGSITGVVIGISDVRAKTHRYESQSRAVTQRNQAELAIYRCVYADNTTDTECPRRRIDVCNAPDRCDSDRSLCTFAAMSGKPNMEECLSSRPFHDQTGHPQYVRGSRQAVRSLTRFHETVSTALSHSTI